MVSAHWLLVVIQLGKWVLGVSSEEVVMAVVSSCFLPLCLVAQLGPALCNPMDCCPHQASLSMEILQARILEWVAMSSSGDLPNPGITPRSPTL